MDGIILNEGISKQRVITYLAFIVRGQVHQPFYPPPSNSTLYVVYLFDLLCHIFIFIFVQEKLFLPFEHMSLSTDEMVSIYRLIDGYLPRLR